jgi:hypothetical protein
MCQGIAASRDQCDEKSTAVTGKQKQTCNSAALILR